jgi:hypothetical protein
MDFRRSRSASRGDRAQIRGGSCPKIACLPSKNVIHSAKVASNVCRSNGSCIRRMTGKPEVGVGSFLNFRLATIRPEPTGPAARRRTAQSGMPRVPVPKGFRLAISRGAVRP